MSAGSSTYSSQGRLSPIPPIYIPDWDVDLGSATPKIPLLCDMFPSMNNEQCIYLLDLFRGDVEEVIQLLLDGVSVAPVLRKFKENNLVAPSKLIQVRPDHIVEDGMRLLYKSEVCISSPVEVEIVDVPAVDLGGLRRQFFSQFLRDMPRMLNLIEENGSNFFLTCNADALVAGHYARLGQVVVHSVLQQGPGFPHLPKAVYYYMIRGVDAAIQYLNIRDIPLCVQYVVDKASIHSSDFV